jgi:hypothetical protein
MFNQEGFGRDPSLYYLWKSHYLPENRMCRIEMRFQVQTPAGTREFFETHVQHGYTIEEVTGALIAAGFEASTVYDAFTLRPPTPRSDRLHFVACRPL